MHPVNEYAEAVVYGELRHQCNKYEILACKRHLSDLEKSKSDNYPYVFDTTRADRIYRHFGNIRRLDDADRMIELEPWQLFDKGCIFGWVEKGTGKRRFKKSYTRIARGHAKTTDAAGVGLYGMCGDALYPPYKPELAKYELNPLVLICAVDRPQGKIAVEDIRNFALNSPALAKRMDIKKTYMRHKSRGGSVEALSKEVKNKDGARPSMIILEEWHAHNTSKIRDTAASGMGKKWQCLEYVITTAGVDAENKPCYKDDLYYKQILEGQVENDNIFIMIREIDDDDDPHDKSCWPKANPFFREMGDYAKILYQQVESEYKEAYQSNDPSKIREFLIKRMNRWQTDSENKYMSGLMEKFKSLGVSREEFARLVDGTKGFYGYDLGKAEDLSGAAYCTYLDDGRLAVSVHGFLPQERATAHEHSDRVPYKYWAKDKWCTLTPGAVTENSYVKKWVDEKNEKWKLIEVDYDGHNATDLAFIFADTYGEDKVVEIPQTCASLNQATKRFRELVLQGKVVHDNSPLLIWCLSNAIEVENVYGDIRLSKRTKDDSQRIDPVAALMNALTRLIRKTDNKTRINDVIKKRGYGLR